MHEDDNVGQQSGRGSKSQQPQKMASKPQLSSPITTSANLNVNRHKAQPQQQRQTSIKLAQQENADYSNG